MRIVGIDPGIAAGKPISIVTIDTDARKVIGVVDIVARDDPLWDKFGTWRYILACVIAQQQPDLVAIENARGVGGRGHALQTLVTLLAEQAEACGVPCVLVHPQVVKSAVCPAGTLRNKKMVAWSVRNLYDCTGLPAGHDYTDAVAVGHAGEAARRLEMAEGV